ncbi:hypothetical protein HNP55_004688 [Paucibacter oligotrophus]|uniref:Uncharacterized protein n=1 Tax=Roseateles oligotrophus TaxID=1769250 RepID=A0A840LBZ0_9BURK|nr:hypothetical protein [Roseateles oligotrophus]
MNLLAELRAASLGELAEVLGAVRISVCEAH